MKLSLSAEAKIRQLIGASAAHLGERTQVDRYVDLTLQLIKRSNVSEARALQAVQDCATIAAQVQRHNRGMAIFVGLVATLLKLGPDAALEAATAALEERTQPR
jgi:hypothetical protein